MNGEQTVLVTGGSGYLGGWCLVELLRRGHRARTTLRSPAREAEVRALVGSQGDAEERLVVVAPGAIIGPVLGPDRSYSLQVIERMLGGMPGIPRLGFSFIDVRDVAVLEVDAMTAPDAAGQRLLAAGPFLWMSEVAQILRENLGEQARKVPTRRVPDFLIRALALFDPGLRTVVGDLGKRVAFSLENSR